MEQRQGRKPDYDLHLALLESKEERDRDDREEFQGTREKDRMLNLHRRDHNLLLKKEPQDSTSHPGEETMMRRLRIFLFPFGPNDEMVGGLDVSVIGPQSKAMKS